MIGYLGEIVFETSSEKARTFFNLSRKTSGRWEAHNLHGRKPELEFSGPDLTVIDFSMRLDMALGINPAEEISEIRTAIEDGAVLPLVMAGDYIGDFVIEDMNETWSYVDNQGNLLVAEIKLKIKEYVADEPGS
jgi:hypothetical protein